ncbi:hypothetical protein STENM223S_05060 [Streptomyces tendae]
MSVLRIGNASGFYGDRFDAVREMLTGGPLDVLTGDYLAELTMLILGRDRLKDPGAGYARTFLRQLEECLGLAHERGVRIVANAGGLNPAGLADAVRALAERLGIPVRVAHVEGDDLTAAHPGALAAHAYLGGFGIAACLRAGADVVVTGRVTDAALVTGPAAAHFGWGPAEHDRLAGAVVAGHVLECGAQATGGNYAFFRDGDVRRPGFPLAELHADGTFVVTKHDGTGGFVDVGTVTAQLLYETGGARYAGPDVTTRLDTVRLTQDGPDRVRVEGVRGEAPPPTLKVGLNRLGGFRNEVAFVLTGLDVEAKAALVRDQMAPALGKVADVRWDLARTDRPDAPTEETASALLRLVVRDPDQQVVGRALSGAADRAGPRRVSRLPRTGATREGRALRRLRRRPRPPGHRRARRRPARRTQGRGAAGPGHRGTPRGTGTTPAAAPPARPGPPCPARPRGRRPQRRQGRRRQRRRVGADRGRLALARPRTDRRPVPRADPGGPRPARHPAPAPQPARPQLRRRGHPRRGRRRTGPLRPPGQGARRMAALPAPGHPGVPAVTAPPYTPGPVDTFVTAPPYTPGPVDTVVTVPPCTPVPVGTVVTVPPYTPDGTVVTVPPYPPEAPL